MTALATTAPPFSRAPHRAIRPGAATGALARSYMLDIPAQDYHADKWAQSCSMLKPALISPAHYLQGLVSPMTNTASMDYGILLHAAVLEPRLLPELVGVFCGDPADRTALRHFQDFNPDRIVVALADYLRLQVAAAKVLEAPFRGRPFHKFVEEGLVERSVYYEDPCASMWCRVRIDLWHPDFTFDLKSTRHATGEGFQRAAVDLNYDMQAYMYSLARCLHEGTGAAKPFVLVQAEAKPPHGVLFRPTTVDFVANGKKKYETALTAVRACTRVELWPAPAGEMELDLLDWQQFN